MMISSSNTFFKHRVLLLKHPITMLLKAIIPHSPPSSLQSFRLRMEIRGLLMR